MILSLQRMVIHTTYHTIHATHLYHISLAKYTSCCHVQTFRKPERNTVTQVDNPVLTQTLGLLSCHKAFDFPRYICKRTRSESFCRLSCIFLKPSDTAAFFYPQLFSVCRYQRMT